mmetsp:Transcript_24277/g.35982  ORF Transcript_24277/g.35982 Transcript_24277/m.35982 type:complete len:267 (-) Transcript_24277:218-1018(-)|eukprot:CAMPEP_0194219296 /NCGR_PEP_ID=MMETSP0156-20130528/25625_1 /TAXON_ID=33649 /ORGANISM="Thalassionema nitzschioides, Strain L26-B" /LENGTH=266 /DNA_ID=CAMNT_0038948905 /DNA_START=35 /DNA_END=835 /DNA_ORIENTATION=-
MASAAALKDYAPAAASLFNNMKTPASILAGAMIPLGFLSPLPQPPAHVKAVPSSTNKKGKQEEETDLAIAITKSFDRMIRKSYLLVTLFSFGSELLAIIWSTVAVNQLTETAVAPAESVWALLKRDWYDLAWAATNSHFFFGMLGFMWMVGTRAYLMVQAKPWNINPVSAGDETNTNTMSIASILMVASSFLLMISIVNRGVASGGGQAGNTYGGSVISLFSHYLTLLFEQAFGLAISPIGPLEILSIVFGASSIFVAAKAIFIEP